MGTVSRHCTFFEVSHPHTHTETHLKEGQSAINMHYFGLGYSQCVHEGLREGRHKQTPECTQAPEPHEIQSALAELPKLIYCLAKVGKELPKQLPEPLSVGKLDVGKFAFSNTAAINLFREGQSR